MAPLRRPVYTRNQVFAENELRAVRALGLQGRGLEVGV